MTSPSDIRAALERLVVADILGPAGGEHEQLPASGPRPVTRVTEHYLIGMLAPRNVVMPSVEENEPLATAASPEDDPPDDTGVHAAGSLFPSSIGLTFALRDSVDRLIVEARWGRYKKEDTDETDERGRAVRVWQRYPMGGTIGVTLSEERIKVTGPVDREQPAVVVTGQVRRIGDLRLVTLFLVNGQPEQEKNNDEAWLFQPQLSVRAHDSEAIFVGRPQMMELASTHDDEERRLDMLYRDTVEFAVGHGIGVHADVDPSNPARAYRVATVVIPMYEVPPTEAPPIGEIPELTGLVLDMKELSSTTQFTPVLQPLVIAYAAWLDDQEKRIARPEHRLGSYEDYADEAIIVARQALQRLEAGIALLDADSVAADAFRFANRAMWQQRVRTTVAEARAQNPALTVERALTDADLPLNRSWRVFQLAFMLLNLPSLTDPCHRERSGDGALVDLLFFPTGGGKTEAYLGLTAYTLAIRRLQGVVAGHDGSDGVAVLMRYTLRLLTSQQFQRAAALICACELIRREAIAAGETRWGDVPFRIGMWVGGSVTPNYSKDADRAIEKARETGGRRTGSAPSPLQLRTCPWCGARINPSRHLDSDPELRRTYVFCGDDFGICPFSHAQSPGEGIPVLTVDEEIYRLLPGLLIATADKFAQLPWRGAVQNLFGRVTRRCTRHGWRNADADRRQDEHDSHLRTKRHPRAETIESGPLRPPDLIIQDELHLISGALGTLVGLYETAVDDLCSWTVDGVTVRPKVIASTATVRRAGAQVYQLFARGLAVFPPPVLDIEDSFFARQRSGSVGRRYLGICAHGVRFKAVEIRMFVAILGAAKKLFEEYGVLVDPYMTLVGYFSAVRELAGMRRLVDDDVVSRLRHADEHGLAKRRWLEVLELTSRAGSDEIPDALDKLKITHRPDREKGTTRPVDVLLATNMISVGVDVARLGLMLVAGQPKATAEYIQATSRVGRDARGPGLVFTAYNWARPRDLSHYERFEHYHATFYRQVEGLSVTPFAPRAIDRGLTAVLVAMLRQRTASTNPNGAAQTLALDSADVAAVRAAILTRADNLQGNGTDVAKAVQARLDEWAVQQHVPARVLGYISEKDGSTVGLLQQPNGLAWDIWTCPNSLRETEPSINLLLEPADPSLEPPREYQFPASDEAARDTALVEGADGTAVTEVQHA
jgi:hypothetical protein